MKALIFVVLVFGIWLGRKFDPPPPEAEPKGPRITPLF